MLQSRLVRGIGVSRHIPPVFPSRMTGKTPRLARRGFESSFVRSIPVRCPAGSGAIGPSLDLLPRFPDATPSPLLGPASFPNFHPQCLPGFR